MTTSNKIRISLFNDPRQFSKIILRNYNINNSNSNSNSNKKELIIIFNNKRPPHKPYNHKLLSNNIYTYTQILTVQKQMVAYIEDWCKHHHRHHL